MSNSVNVTLSVVSGLVTAGSVALVLASQTLLRRAKRSEEPAAVSRKAREGAVPSAQEESAEAESPPRPSKIVSRDSAESQALEEVAAAGRRIGEQTEELLAASSIPEMVTAAGRLGLAARTVRQLLMGPLLASSFPQLDPSFELRRTDSADLAVDVVTAVDYLLSLREASTVASPLVLSPEPGERSRSDDEALDRLTRRRLDARGDAVRLGMRLFAELRRYDERSARIPLVEALNRAIPEEDAIMEFARSSGLRREYIRTDVTSVGTWTAVLERAVTEGKIDILLDEALRISPSHELAEAVQRYVEAREPLATDE